MEITKKSNLGIKKRKREEQGIRKNVKAQVFTEISRAKKETGL